MLLRGKQDYESEKIFKDDVRKIAIQDVKEEFPFLVALHEEVLNARKRSLAMHEYIKQMDNMRLMTVLEKFHEVIENDSLHEVGKKIFDRSVDIQKNIETQAERTFPSFDPVKVEESSKKARLPKLIESRIWHKGNIR